MRSWIEMVLNLFYLAVLLDAIAQTLRMGVSPEEILQGLLHLNPGTSF
ncbi:hypothetical protein [Nostoc sp. MG11]|nr:hypothetical protein [Nostoc sp. MG11]